MNRVFLDPDIKIYMSLDDIIQLSGGQIHGQISRKLKRRKKNNPRGPVDNCCNHSVPLLPSSNGVGIYVSRKSSLLTREHRRWITKAFSNRALNCDLLKKSKVTIPAEYKLVHTNEGIERILVPTEGNFSELNRKKLSPPRKLNRTSACNEPLPCGPPPLVTAPIYSPPLRKSANGMCMDVDDSDDDIVILDVPNSKKEFDVIDVECNLPVDVECGVPVIEDKEIYVTAPSLRQNCRMKTLSERFTMLTGSLQF